MRGRKKEEWDLVLNLDREVREDLSEEVTCWPRSIQSCSSRGGGEDLWEGQNRVGASLVCGKDW